MDKQQAGRVTQKEHNDLLEAWREQVEEARRGQEAGWSLAQGLARNSADAYADFLDSIFFYYGENARAAEKALGKGSESNNSRRLSTRMGERASDEGSPQMCLKLRHCKLRTVASGPRT